MKLIRRDINNCRRLSNSIKLRLRKRAKTARIQWCKGKKGELHKEVTKGTNPKKLR